MQRGTGLSTPLTSSSMSQLKTAKDLADYIKYFRADNIVNDAEFIRIRLVPDAGSWTVLGQVLFVSLVSSELCVCIRFLNIGSLAYPSADDLFN